MGKGLAITGFLISIVFILTFVFNLYSLAWLGLTATILGFLINLLVLIRRLDGKKYTIMGLIFNILFVLLFYVLPAYLG